jgi:hypothetical protein
MRNFGRLKDQPISVMALGLIITLVLFVGFGIFAAVIIATSNEKEYFQSSFCWKNGCVKDYLVATEQAFSIAKATLDFGVAIATIGGIFVALLSYFTTSTNAALTNHIEHLKVFGDYLDAEITKRDRLSRQQIDTLFLYGKIFSKSRMGKTTVSRDYTQFVEKLNILIEESNSRSVVGTPGGFSYNDHQQRIRDHMASAGVVVYMAPRNDYFEMEGQLFSLLHRISQSFCNAGSVPELVSRKYC